MPIDEFTAKKLGEVVAFSRIGQEVVKRGGDAFVEAMGVTAHTFGSELLQLEESALSFGSEVTTQKAEKTTVKLRTMMEQYVGDEWDNPVELLEWLSFFTGAGSAHWALLRGVAEGSEHTELLQLSETGQQQYHQYLHATIEALQATGRKRISEAA